MSYYVKRSSKQNPVGFAYVGPITSEAQANKEATAWVAAGETVEILPSSQELKREVRQWDKLTHADDAREIVTFRGEQMTYARYRLCFEA